MNDFKSLAASIVGNLQDHQVNRAEKMDRTIDKMCSNVKKKEEQINKAIKDGVITDISNRGYGEGRKMGD